MNGNQKKLLVVSIILVGILIIGGVYIYIESINQKDHRATETETNQTNQRDDAVKTREGEIVDEYNMDGMSEFSTIVEGYYKDRDFSIESDEKGNPVILGKMAYLVALNFEDKNFEESLKINSYNLKDSKENKYIFDLGLIKDGKIDCTNYVDNTSCIDEITNEKIINSTAEKPVRIELFFGKRDYPVFTRTYKIRVAGN